MSTNSSSSSTSPRLDSLYSGTQTFWQNYLRGRPHVPESFFSRIYTYHSTYSSGSFETVHDAGAGVGVHSARLAQQFQHVLLTDPSEQNIEYAKLRLPNTDDKKYSFKVCKLEDSVGSGSVREGSVDMVFAATMLHYVDPEIAMEAVAKQLKPGGTFVGAVWGLAWMEEEDVQAVWAKLFRQVNKQYMSSEGVRAGLGDGYRKTVRIAATGYDAIPVREEDFVRGVIRLKINYPSDEDWYSYCVPVGYEEECPHWSQVGEGDVVRREEESGWELERDIDGLKEVMETFPFVDLTKGEMGRLWEELKEVVGDRKVKGRWPASVILATKK